MTILVTGATGNVGRIVVDLLREAGASVRTASRNPQAADVRLDFTDPTTYEAALTGVRKVFLYVAGPQGAEAFANAAKQAGVRHVVLLSSLAVAMSGGEGDDAITQMHVGMERAIEKSGVAWTFLRPGGFSTNTLFWARSVKDDGVVRIFCPDVKLSPIHERDIAEVGVRALLDEDERHHNAAYLLSGPQELTQRDQVELIGKAIGRPVTVQALTRAEAGVQFQRQFGEFAKPEVVESLLDWTESQVGVPSEVYDTVEKITGRPARTFEQWAIDHKAAFTE
jgi:uncharacterized protein YbjT (DUF2867 family)